MSAALAKHWFLVGLAVLIPGGLIAGGQGAAGAVVAGIDAAGLSSLAAMVPRLSTAVVLFLMAFSLDSGRLRASLQAPLPVLWASLVNYGLIPLLAWPLQAVQLSADFAVGLMIAAAAPCTMAAASVWTRSAKGNDAVSLMVTLLTNSACFVVAPFWLLVTTQSRVEIDGWFLMQRLLVAVLVPVALGQFLRLSSVAAEFADVQKKRIGIVAQSLILFLVLLAAVNAGERVATTEGAPPGLAGIAVVWVCCLGLHVVAMFVAGTGSTLLGFAPADRTATLFAGSQKTLPIGVLLATDPAMFGNPDLGVPFAVFPILMYHASQLFFDTFVADRVATTSNAPE